MDHRLERIPSIVMVMGVGLQHFFQYWQPGNACCVVSYCTRQPSTTDLLKLLLEYVVPVLRYGTGKSP